MQRFILLVSCCFFGLLLQAQNYGYDGFLKAADNAIARNDHFNAMRFYESALAFKDEDEQDPEVRFKMGVEAYKARSYVKAQNALSQVVSQLTPNDGTTLPLARYYLARVFLRQGNYAEATTQFENFLAQNPAPNAEYQALANRALANADWAAIEILNDRDVSLRHLGNVINTPDSDFGYTVQQGSEDLYSSHSYRWRNDTLTNPRNLSRIRKVVNEEMVMPLPELINVDDKIVATSSFNMAGNTVYYGICEYRDAAMKFDVVRCDLYRATVGADNRWTDPVMLDINMAGYSTAMPSVGTDASGQEFLYFSSDRPGGMGEMDIYRAAINADATIGTPENLSSINSSEMDVTPFFYSAGQILYFSTDGRQTLGGLDLHKSYLRSDGFSEPQNLGAPINSSYEDAYYSRFSEDKAYLSTSRPSAYNVAYDKDSDVCCYDIYEFEPDDGIRLDVLTFNQCTGGPLNYTTVELYEVTTTEVVFIATATNAEGNDVQFELQPGKVYELRASLDGFSPAIDRFDLSDPAFAGLDVISRELRLGQVLIEASVFNRANGEELPNTPVYLFEILDDGSERLVETKSGVNTHQVDFAVELGKRYRIEAERGDFFGASTTETIDLTGDYATPAECRIKKDLYLGQLLRIFVIDGNTNEPLNGATINLSFLDGDLIANETKPNSNLYEYVISLDQFFDLRTRKDEYIPDPREDILTFSQADLEAGNGILEFIVPLFNNLCTMEPIRLFFDNDLPDSNTLATTTRLPYDDTYFDYADRESIFQRRWSQGSDDPFEAEVEIENFFRTELRQGFRDLEQMAQLLYDHARNGGQFDLVFSGYTSPKAPTGYNYNLSLRRIRCILNYFENWEGGQLWSFIGRKGQTDRPITYDPLPRGETAEGEPDVSDSQVDVQQSIFSPTASLRRRVEVSGSCPEPPSTDPYRK